MLFIPESNPDFSGIAVEVHAPLSRGIYDISQSLELLHTSVSDFYHRRGVVTVKGYRGGIGGAAGHGAVMSFILKALPGVGKATLAAIAAARSIRRKIVKFRKRRMRPFQPTAGIHFDLWPAADRRPRTKVATLVEALDTLPQLCQHMASEHPSVKLSFLVTGNAERIAIPHLSIDSDACDAESMISLAGRVQKDLAKGNGATHYTVTRKWGLWTKIERHTDPTGAFHLVFGFPNR